MMRVALINTGTELLLGDVHDAHLAFIAREIFPLGLRIGERRTVPDGEAIRGAVETRRAHRRDTASAPRATMSHATSLQIC